MSNNKASPKLPIQFKMGFALLEEIDDAVLFSNHNSRNAWMVDAVRRLLIRGDALPHPITAGQLLHNKVTIMIRLDELTLELVDEQCDDKEMDRTLWLLDAMVSQLAEQMGSN